MKYLREHETMIKDNFQPGALVKIKERWLIKAGYPDLGIGIIGRAATEEESVKFAIPMVPLSSWFLVLFGEYHDFYHKQWLQVVKKSTIRNNNLLLF